MSALLLLDLDNTLADRAAAFEHWAGTQLNRWAPTDDGAIAFLHEQDCDGFAPREAFLASVRDRFELVDSVEELLADYRRITLEGFPPLDEDVAEQLRSLRADGWRVGVVTNGDAGVQEATVKRIGLEPLIDACVVSGSAGIAKPNRRIFENAAEKCGRPLTDAWMIGDAEIDVAGAAAAGMRSVWLTRGRTWERADITPTLTAGTAAEALALAQTSI